MRSGQRERDPSLDIDRKVLQTMSGEDRQHLLVSDHRDAGSNVIEWQFTEPVELIAVASGVRVRLRVRDEQPPLAMLDDGRLFA